MVLTYGGVRGAVGIAFALIVQHDPHFSDIFKSNMLLHMSGVVLLTLLSKIFDKSKCYNMQFFNKANRHDLNNLL